MGDNLFIGANARSYLRSYRKLAKYHYEQSTKLESWYSNYFFPLCTILIFGIELHIKWLLSDPSKRINDNIRIETHSLSKLFQMLTVEVKKEIIGTWFKYFKLRGGMIKPGYDKYKFFNTFITDFDDAFEAMRYVHEDYADKREAFDLLLLLFEPLLFSFCMDKKDYENFITEVVKYDTSEEKKIIIKKILLCDRNFAIHNQGINSEHANDSSEICDNIASLETKSLYDLYDVYSKLLKK